MTTAPFLDGLILLSETQGAYGLRLVGDLEPEDMLAQPVPDRRMNHPAWILSHLAAYHPVIAGIARGESVQDPIDHPHGKRSAPTDDPGDYLPHEQLVESYAHGEANVVQALRTVTLERLRAPVPIERFRERFGSVAEVLVHLVIHHPSVHLGQLSAWRRAGGRDPV